MPATSHSGAPASQVLKNIKALILDCDGVLTDGAVVYDENGLRTLSFFARDGLGLAMLTKSDVAVAVLSGRPTDIAELRHKELGVGPFVGRCGNKSKAVAELAETLGVTLEQCAFMGDDLADLGAMQRCALSIAPYDAVAEVIQQADWVTEAAGGRGAVREVCEGLMRAQGSWNGAIERFMPAS